MKSIAIIPARGGSKGIPKKNIKDLCGKPLLQYTIEAARKSRIDVVVVSTDCQEIRQVAELLGCRVIMRPDHLATDTAGTLAVLQHAVSQIDEYFEFVVTLQPTSPLRTHVHINEALSLIDNDSNADSLVSVVKVPHNFSISKQMLLGDGYLVGKAKVERRQDVKVMYARNGAGIYITRIKCLSEFIFGGKILPYVMDSITSLDIDDIEDWVVVEALMK